MPRNNYNRKKEYTKVPMSTSKRSIMQNNNLSEEEAVLIELFRDFKKASQDRIIPYLSTLCVYSDGSGRVEVVDPEGAYIRLCNFCGFHDASIHLNKIVDQWIKDKQERETYEP